MNSNRELKPDASWKAALMSVGIALSLPWTIGVPAFIGYLIDKEFGYQSIFLITGFMVGLISGVLEIFILIKRMKLMK